MTRLIPCVVRLDQSADDVSAADGATIIDPVLRFAAPQPEDCATARALDSRVS
jgi:hypothetical protein